MKQSGVRPYERACGDAVSIDAEDVEAALTVSRAA
jgi:hypothetical protein